MNGSNATMERTGVVKMRNGYLCPDCGDAMAEAERTNEKGFSFIWYKCLNTQCGGHRLEKRFAAIRDF
jgi:hypothetical protein